MDLFISYNFNLKLTLSISRIAKPACFQCPFAFLSISASEVRILEICILFFLSNQFVSLFGELRTVIFRAITEKILLILLVVFYSGWIKFIFFSITDDKVLLVYCVDEFILSPLVKCFLFVSCGGNTSLRRSSDCLCLSQTTVFPRVIQNGRLCAAHLLSLTQDARIPSQGIVVSSPQ